MADMVFTSFAQLGAHLNEVRRRVPEGMRESLDQAAYDTLAIARNMFGKYQPKVGPFPAWDPLTPETIARRQRRGINAEDEPLLESGDLKDSYDVAYDGNSVVIGSDSPYASAQETGTEHIPPRPVLGPALIKAQKVSSFDEVFMDIILQGRRFRNLNKSKAAMDSTITPGYGGADNFAEVDLG